MERYFYILLAISCFVIAILAVIIAMLFRKGESLQLLNDTKSFESDQWRANVLQKIKEKIDATNIATMPLRKGEDVVANFIYQKHDTKALGEELMNLFAEQVSTVRHQFPELTDLDILVIILLGLDFDNVEICSLLRMEKRTLYRRRQLIAQRLGLQSSLNLEQFAAEVLAAQCQD